MENTAETIFMSALSIGIGVIVYLFSNMTINRISGIPVNGYTGFMDVYMNLTQFSHCVGSFFVYVLLTHLFKFIIKRNNEMCGCCFPSRSAYNCPKSTISEEFKVSQQIGNLEIELKKLGFSYQKLWNTLIKTYKLLQKSLYIENAHT